MGTSDRIPYTWCEVLYSSNKSWHIPGTCIGCLDLHGRIFIPGITRGTYNFRTYTRRIPLINGHFDTPTTPRFVLPSFYPQRLRSDASVAPRTCTTRSARTTRNASSGKRRSKQPHLLSPIPCLIFLDGPRTFSLPATLSPRGLQSLLLPLRGRR